MDIEYIKILNSLSLSPDYCVNEYCLFNKYLHIEDLAGDFGANLLPLWVKKPSIPAVTIFLQSRTLHFAFYANDTSVQIESVWQDMERRTSPNWIKKHKETILQCMRVLRMQIPSCLI